MEKQVVLERKGYRAAMVNKFYQAQLRCPACSSWVLTQNLEVFKDELGIRVAAAQDVTCTQTGCGEVLESVLFKDWQYSAPVKWRR